MTATSGAFIEADNKNYIKEHSWSGFKSGIKYSSYVYLGATIASLLISLTIAPIFPFVLLASNPVAWVMLGVAYVVLSGLALAIIKPLFHLAYDNINKEKYQTEAPSSLLSDVEVSKRELFLDSEGYSTLVHNTVSGNYDCWLRGEEIMDIAQAVYKYDCNPRFRSYLRGPGSIFFTVQALRAGYIKNLFRKDFIGTDMYEEEKKKEGEPNRPILALVFSLNNNHYVTFVIVYDKKSKNSMLCYCDPLYEESSPLEKEILDFLKQEHELKDEDIKICKTKQQKDGHNCGIYALENTKIIIDMMKAGRSLDEIDKKLTRHKLTPQQLKEKRREFAKVLIDSVSHMSTDQIEENFAYWGRVLRKKEPSKGICRMV